MLNIQPKGLKSKAARYNDNRLANKQKQESPSNTSQNLFAVNGGSNPCSLLEVANKNWSVKHNELLSQNNELAKNMANVSQQWNVCTENISVQTQNNIHHLSENSKLSKKLTFVDLQYNLCMAHISELTSENSELAKNLTFVGLQWSLCTDNISMSLHKENDSRLHLHDILQHNTLLIAENSELVKNLTFLDIQWNLCKTNVLNLIQNDTYLSVHLYNAMQNNTKLFSENSKLAQNLSFLELQWNTCTDNVSELVHRANKSKDSFSELMQNITQCSNSMKNLSLELYNTTSNLNRMKETLSLCNEQQKMLQTGSYISPYVAMCNCTELFHCNIRNVQLTDSVTNCEHNLSNLIVNTSRSELFCSNCSGIVTNVSTVDDLFFMPDQPSENSIENVTLHLNSCLVAQDVFEEQLNSCLHANMNFTENNDLCYSSLADTHHLFSNSRLKLAKLRKTFRAKKHTCKIKQSNMALQIDHWSSKTAYYISYLRKYLTINRVLNETVKLCHQQANTAKETLLNSTLNVQKLDKALNVSWSQIDYLSDIISQCIACTNKTWLVDLLRNPSLWKDSLNAR
jgi:hypothetical protein